MRLEVCVIPQDSDRQRFHAMAQNHPIIFTTPLASLWLNRKLNKN